MRSLFSAGENLSDCSSHVSDQRRNGVVGRDLALSVLHVARFTAISYFTKDERTNTLHASSTDGPDCAGRLYLHSGPTPLSRTSLPLNFFLRRHALSPAEIVVPGR